MRVWVENETGERFEGEGAPSLRPLGLVCNNEGATFLLKLRYACFSDVLVTRRVSEGAERVRFFRRKRFGLRKCAISKR